MKKTALVTGGTRGLGAAIALELKNNDYHVFSTFHSGTEKAEAFSKDTGIETVQFDVSDLSACEKSVGEILKKSDRIDVLVNNAGIIKDSAFVKMDHQRWSDVINVNLNSLYNVTKQVVPSMIEHGFGRIINISSVNGIMGAYGQTNYATSKAGIFGFTKSLALELASKGITVNAIAPGYCETEMMEGIPEKVMEKILATIPLRRLCKASEIAKGVVFLADETSAYITGNTLSINGGQNMN